MYSIFRRTHTTLFLLIAFAVLEVSCTNENETKNIDDNPLSLPKTIEELYQDGSNVGGLKGTFKYEGNKLVEIFYNYSQKKVFTYTGDLISKIEQYQAEIVRFEFTYSYENGKLISYLNRDLLTNNKEEVTYIYESDGSISFLQIFSFNGRPDWQKEGKLVIENGNLIESVAEFNFYNASNEYNLLINLLEYDDKPSPYKNVLGYTVLLNLNELIGTNNILTDYVYSTSFRGGSQYAESITGTEYEISYDNKGRPTQLDRFSNKEIGGDLLRLDRIYKIKY
jgi:hypothetical protein